MNIAIFGATSGTGHILAEKCLSAGHAVTALVRDPARLDVRGRCRLVVGDARDAAAVAEAIRGADAVFSTLGARTPFEKSDLLARAVPHIVATMQAQNVQRLIVLGAGGWQPGSLRRSSPLRQAIFKLVGRTLLKHPIESQRAQETVILPSSLDWTIVAPTRLRNSDGRGMDHVRVDTEALPAGAAQIARADVAAVMFRALEDHAWIRQRVYVTW